MSEPEPLNVFFSYAHQDEGLRDRLATHLKLLQRERKIHPWQYRDITGGQEWEGQIHQHLRKADIILLLISPDFIGSDYCWDVEVDFAMRRHKEGAARTIPVVLRPTDWSSAPFHKLQALPRHAKAITTWSNQDEALVDVTRGLRSVIKDLQAANAAAAAQAPAPDDDDESFQACLVYNDEDEGDVAEVARQLRSRGVKLWFKKTDLRPGIVVAAEFEKRLQQSKTAAIFVGSSAMAPWQDASYQAALSRAVEKKTPMIPVLLPDTGNRPDLPLFLGTYEWIEIPRLSDPESMARLEWGITGKKPADLGY